MNLPTVNRSRAIRKSAFILFLSTWPTLLSSDITIIIAGLSIGILYGFFAIRKHNIGKASLVNNQIILKYNWNKYYIPVSEIKEITSALMAVTNFKGKLTTEYCIELTKQHPFGEYLFLEFEHYGLPFEEPVIISTIKAISEYENRKSNNSDFEK